MKTEVTREVHETHDLPTMAARCDCHLSGLRRIRRGGKQVWICLIDGVQMDVTDARRYLIERARTLAYVRYVTRAELDAERRALRS